MKHHTEIYTLPYVHSYIKYYPHQTKLYIFNKPLKTREPSNHERLNRRNNNNNIGHSPFHLDSIRRSKTAITDFVLSNDFSLFVTFTFDQAKIDRSNQQECRKKISKWLNNQTSNNNIKYIIVPELHKDGNIHFHALTTELNIKIATNPNNGQTIVKNNKPVYNITNYKLGNTVAQYITDNDKQTVTNYLTKYITKDLSQSQTNKRRYWRSLNLTTVIKETNPQISEETYTQLIHNNSTKKQFEHFTLLTIPTNLQEQISPKEQQPCQQTTKSKISTRQLTVSTS